MELRLLSERKNNKIYTNGKDLFKIYNKEYDKAKIFLEAFITSKMESLGINVPKIKELGIMDGCWYHKTPDVGGKSIYELLVEDPDNADKHLQLMVEVQNSLFSYTCSDLPLQRRKLYDYISASELDEEVKHDLHDNLNSSPKHQKLCHGSLTPHNIIVREDEIIITDWNHACLGNASADAAQSYLWLKVNMPEYAEKYLSLFSDTTHTTPVYLRRWIPIVAAARLVRNIPEETEILKSLISVDFDY